MTARINPRILEHEHVAVKQCRHGYFAYNVNDLYIGRSLDVYGEWGEEEVAVLSQVLKEGAIVVDAGANVGTHTVPLAKRVGRSGAVFALEPQPLTFQLLCANVALNALVNVHCHNVAATDRPGDLRIPVLNPSQRTNFGAVKAEGHEQGRRVDAIRIDDLALPRCNLIKIDVEGMEPRVLAGASRVIARHRPVLFVENNREEHSAPLLAALRELDYNAWWHIAPYYNPRNFFANDEDVFPNHYPEANLLCFPRGSTVNINLWPVEGADDTFIKAVRRHSAALEPPGEL